MEGVYLPRHSSFTIHQSQSPDEEGQGGGVVEEKRRGRKEGGDFEVDTM